MYYEKLQMKEQETMVEYHADDYGLFPEQSRRILQCITDGICNGISIMPNSPYLDQCMKMLELKKDIRIAIHLNLVEGRALCTHDEIPDLTDKEGVFQTSFIKLFIQSFLPRRKSIQDQITKEFRAQISNSLKYMVSGIRLDSHMHLHMIPVVFDALIQVLKEDGIQPSYIRFPQEELTVYKKHRKEMTDRLWINRIKVMLLNKCVRRNQKIIRKIDRFEQSKDLGVFAGVMYSGRMNYQNVVAIQDDLIRIASKRKANVEILFHPGAVKEKEDLQRLTLKDDISFLSDLRRDIEAYALLKLHPQLPEHFRLNGFPTKKSG